MSWYPPQDGKRFVASVQKKIDEPNVYVDFYESDSEAEAKKEAKAITEREGLKSIVFERGNGVVHRFNVDDAIPTPPEPPKGKKGKKR